MAAPGHRLPPSTRPGAVRLQVAALDRSIAFYRDVLGFRVRERAGSRAVLGPEGDGAPLVELRERPGAAPAPAGGRPGLYHFALLLPDRASLGAFVRHLSERGVRAGASDHAVSEALYLRDPDGLGIEVYADRPRETWRKRGDELVMVTEPLDVAAVARAAGDARWTGLPEGTVVGHLHLHVGDLAEAGAFYRALGLAPTVWSYPGALFLSAGGYHHHLGLNSWMAEVTPAPESEARLLEWELLLPTAEAVERARTALEDAGYGVETVGDGAAAVTRDPWGTTVRLRVG